MASPLQPHPVAEGVGVLLEKPSGVLLIPQNMVSFAEDLNPQTLLCAPLHLQAV
jgi:hypothetical protein